MTARFAGIGADDLRQMGSVAHKLKGSSRAVGALAVDDLCSTLENACRLGSRESVGGDMLQFEAALRDVEAHIGHLEIVS